LQKKSDEEIIEDLATEFYRRRLKDSDDTLLSGKYQDDSGYCINVDGEKEMSDVSCIFMLDVNTPAKVHFGAMHWNMIDLMKQSSERESNSLVSLALSGHFCASYSVSQIPDGECVRYASIQEYFVLCCCYETPELCAYTISNKSMSNVKANREIWESNIEVRNSVLANELRKNTLDTPTSSWTYRDFIYSKPMTFAIHSFTFRGDQKEISSIRNVPLWHCAVGRFMVYSIRDINTSAELDRLKRKDLPVRTEYCIADFWIEFKHGQTESIIFDAKADTKQECNSIESVFCQLIGPECLNDLLYVSNIQAQYQCCCNRGNLCNHWGNSNPSKSKYQISLKPKDFHNVIFQCHIKAIAYLTQIFLKRTNADLSEICWRSFDYHFEQEILMIPGVSYQREMIYRVARKEFSDQYLSLQQTCDENMADYFKQYKNTLKRPTCYEAYHQNGPLVIDLYSVTRKINFTGILIKRVMTNSTPICVTFIKISRESISFGIYALRPSKTAAEAKNSKRLTTFKRHQTNTFVQRCQSNSTKSCNGFPNLIEHLLPLTLHRYAGDREPSGYSKCYITDDLQRINCRTNLGCFDFHSFDGERQRGCIDDIPKLIKEKPKLLVLNYCKHAKLWKFRSYTCNGIHNITYSHVKTLDGVLCCCKKICPLR
uniref:Protein kinase domain-containing protein n=1 Tax=Brugia pahangi TaxID=6280 RepID=A0A158PSR6_BRUPA